jgi:hypothetical protein
MLERSPLYLVLTTTRSGALFHRRYQRDVFYRSCDWWTGRILEFLRYLHDLCLHYCRRSRRDMLCTTRSWLHLLVSLHAFRPTRYRLTMSKLGCRIWRSQIWPYYGLDSCMVVLYRLDHIRSL